MTVHPINPVAQEARVNLLVAAFPLWKPAVRLDTGERGWSLPSQSEPGKRVLVIGGECSCKSWKYRRDCAHLAAVAEFERGHQQQASGALVTMEAAG